MLNVLLALAQLAAGAGCRQAIVCGHSLLSNIIVLRVLGIAPARSGRLERERQHFCQRWPNTALWNVPPTEAVE